MEKLHLEMKECSACKLRAGCTQVVPGEGPKSATVIFIAEAPGASEDEQGRPLIGKSGRLFRAALRSARIKEEEVYISNTCRCRAPENRDPEPDEVEACWKWTLKTLQTIRPKTIVTLGYPATQTIAYKFGIRLPTNKITKLAGKPTYLADRHFYLYPMLHPAYAARGRDNKQIFFAHMKYLAKAIPGWEKKPRRTD